jgi:hypothetical protein
MSSFHRWIFAFDLINFSAYTSICATCSSDIADCSKCAEKLIRSNAKIQRWNDDIGRLNRGENVRVDLIIKTEQEQLNIIYDRIKDEKVQLKVIADEQIVVQENKLAEYAERTKNDLALLQQRPDGKIDEETGKSEKERFERAAKAKKATPEKKGIFSKIATKLRGGHETQEAYETAKVARKTAKRIANLEARKAAGKSYSKKNLAALKAS